MYLFNNRKYFFYFNEQTKNDICGPTYFFLKQKKIVTKIEPDIANIEKNLSIFIYLNIFFSCWLSNNLAVEKLYIICKSFIESRPNCFTYSRHTLASRKLLLQFALI